MDGRSLIPAPPLPRAASVPRLRSPRRGGRGAVVGLALLVAGVLVAAVWFGVAGREPAGPVESPAERRPVSAKPPAVQSASDEVAGHAATARLAVARGLEHVAAAKSALRRAAPAFEATRDAWARRELESAESYMHRVTRELERTLAELDAIASQKGGTR